MAKTLITYFSRTGNTRQIAEAIEAAVPGNKECRPLAEIESVEGYDLLFVGFPVQTHSIPHRVEQFLKTIPRGKNIALFSTHGSLTGGRLSREALEHAASLVSSARLLGTFSCRGKVSQEALEVLSRSPEHKAWSEMAGSARTHPDEHDSKEAAAFARWVLTLAAG
ncbi:MAG: flavodoxin family protein [Acidobacteria bacterium]|nr:flavodoxin family protein [Acidobacteriota bacterium]MCG2816588.1 flavodoxin family protein [Candidatus Aminicenantes bacterium]MBU1473482.1 flavodoxin family protein [Acidobacteriota bacterium]MBU4203975.1 flavodoxin family protein [Acidobacteriota bacterium]MBU4253922.1 flavodoxin family protein [Acidobacteriota bacterium]